MKNMLEIDFNANLVEAGIKRNVTTRYQLDCIETLAAGLVFEFRKGQKSEIWPFLNILPRTFSTLLEHWPEKLTILMPNYSIVHKIVHSDLKLLVREICMCFELLIIVHASSHSIRLLIFELIIIVFELNGSNVY